MQVLVTCGPFSRWKLATLNHEIQVRWVLRQILKGLEFLHRAGLSHCSLCTTSVLFTSMGEVRLGDWGLAYIVEPKFSRQWEFAKPLHPEEVGPPRDVWALGILIAELALPTGLPYRHAKATAVDLVSLLGSCMLPPDALDLVGICLVIAPHLRPTVEQLQDHPFLGVEGVNEVEAQKEISAMCRGGTWWEGESESGEGAKTAVCRGCGEVTDYSAVFLQEELFLCDECLEKNHAECELGERNCPTCKSLGQRLRSRFSKSFFCDYEFLEFEVRWLRQRGICKVKGDLLSEGRCRWSTENSPLGASKATGAMSTTSFGAFTSRRSSMWCKTPAEKLADSELMSKGRWLTSMLTVL